MAAKAGKKIICVALYIIFYGMVISGIMYACLKCYDFTYLAFSNPVYQKDNSKVTDFVVKSGQSDKEIMLSLQEQGIVENGYAAWLKLSFNQGKIQPGNYELTPSMSLNDILEAMEADRQQEENH